MTEGILMNEEVLRQVRFNSASLRKVGRRSK